MRRRLTGFLIVLTLLLGTHLAVLADGGGVEITYLGNEGFLIAASETRVLVDALYGDGLRGYPVVPAAERRRAEEATGPFAGVDLVLASHHHGDHFDPAAVGRHLAHNPEARFVSTEQAVESLRRGFAGWADVAGRVAGFWPAEGERAAFEHAGVRLTVLNLHHGRGRKPPVQNLGLLIDVGGLRLLHLGDTEVDADDVRPYKLREEGIDVALVPYWFFLDDSFRPVLDEIGARHAVAMHLPSPDAPKSYFEPGNDLEGLKAAIRGRDPRTWVPEGAPATKRFHPSASAAAPADG